MTETFSFVRLGEAEVC